jgi:hypothetical protein
MPMAYRMTGPAVTRKQLPLSGRGHEALARLISLALDRDGASDNTGREFAQAFPFPARGIKPGQAIGRTALTNGPAVTPI